MYGSGYRQINDPASRKQSQTNGNISPRLQEMWRIEDPGMGVLEVCVGTFKGEGGREGVQTAKEGK